MKMGSVIVENGKEMLTMADYIDREALRQFPIRKDHYDKKNGNEHFIFGIETVMEYAESLPAADVAPVVRCRDCKHAWIHPCGYVLCHRDGRSAYEMTFNLDSFCSYGERKDNG